MDYTRWITPDELLNQQTRGRFPDEPAKIKCAQAHSGDGQITTGGVKKNSVFKEERIIESGFFLLDGFFLL